MASPIQRLVHKSLDELLVIWDALQAQSWGAGDFYSEHSALTMDDWAGAVQSEINNRRSLDFVSSCR